MREDFLMTRTVKKTPANTNAKAGVTKKKRAVKKKVASKKAAKSVVKKSKAVASNKAVKTPKPVAKKTKKIAPKAATPKKIVKKTIKKTTPKRAMKKSVKTMAKKAAPKKVLSSTEQTPVRESVSKTATYDVMKQTIKEMTMNQDTKQFEQFSQDAASASREGVEAFIQSQTIFKKGMEDIFRAGMSFAQMSAEKQAKYVQEAMGAKTLNDFTEFQNKAAKESFDDFVSSATKISEMSSKMLSEASEPINAQMTKSAEAVQKATKAAA